MRKTIIWRISFYGSCISKTQRPPEGTAANLSIPQYAFQVGIAAARGISRSFPTKEDVPQMASSSAVNICTMLGTLFICRVRKQMQSQTTNRVV
jgi:hypothetical protein